MHLIESVCVIGAGAAGLCAARHLKTAFNRVAVFEQHERSVGGTWIYTDKTGSDERGNPIHSSMYRNLKTNLPKEVMAFPDFPIEGCDGRSFLTHQEVRKYLEDYSRRFDLEKHIEFNTRVTKVSPSFDADGRFKRWDVELLNLNSDAKTKVEFDACLVCNGHYSVPHLASIPGIDAFEGQSSHSHTYRRPEAFAGKTVAILGASSSGVDICLEVASTAKSVFICHNKPRLVSKLPENVRQTAGIVECAGKDSFLLKDGRIIDRIDCLLHCTGYEFVFPFLSDSCNVRVENNVVRPLFKHMIHSEFPSMAFIGIPLQITPFPLFDMQIQWFGKVLKGDFKLPSREEMNSQTRNELEAKIAAGIPERHFHKFGSYQWKYNDHLADLAGIKRLNPGVEQLYDLVHDRRTNFLLQYKADNYEGYILKK